MSTIITDNPYTFTVADNMNINAVFENNTATITVYKYPSCYITNNINTGITVSGGGTKIVGSTCTLTATPPSGASVYGTYFAWLDLETGNVLGTNSTLSFTVSKDQTIYCATIRSDSTNDSLDYGSGGSGPSYNATVKLHDGSTKTISVSGTWKTDTTIKQYNVVSIVPTTSVSGNFFLNNFGFPFNLVHDTQNPLGLNLWGAYLYSASAYFGVEKAYVFGPRNGETIHLKNSTPWMNQSSTPKYIVFQQKNAPDFNVKMDIPSGVEVHYPSYGVGYNSDWVARNFKSNTPTLVKDNKY